MITPRRSIGRGARLDAAAATRAFIQGDIEAMAIVLASSEKPRELAHALTAIAAVALLKWPRDAALHFLDGWTSGASSLPPDAP